MALAIAAAKRHKAAVIDIGGAYLNAEMTGEEVLMELDQVLTRFVMKACPECIPYVDHKGKMVVKLDKALYGLIQSAKLWYDKLCGVLEKMGFVKNPVDPCVLNRGEGKHLCTLVVFVDDILALSEMDSEIQSVIDDLRAEFVDVTAKISADFSYLGMHIVMKKEVITVTMEGFVQELMETYEVTKGADTPATGRLFSQPDSRLLSRLEKEMFHSVTAKLLYLALRIKPEILLAVNVLSTRVQNPTQDDKDKLERVLQYVYSTQEVGINITGEGIDQIYGMIDASFANHGDGKSQSGMALMLGSTLIMAKSTKQKIVSKDSTEAELVALSDMMRHVDKANQFMIAQGMVMQTPILGQDNQSTISLVTLGGGIWRNKYMKVRQESVRERILSNDFIVKYYPTELMIADILTKPLTGNVFREMRDMLIGKVVLPCA